MKKLVSFMNTVALLGMVALPSVANAANPENVAVSATVSASLTLSQAGGPIALGVLDGTFAGNQGGVTFTITTNNATGGQLDVVSGGLKSATREIGVTDIAGGISQTAAVDYYKISTAGVPVFTTANSAITTVAGADMLATQTVYDGTGPVSGATQLVTVGAQIDTALTDAGSYSDTLVATLTANP